MIFKAILTPAQGGQYGPVYPSSGHAVFNKQISICEYVWP